MSAALAGFVGGFGIPLDPRALRLPFALALERSGTLRLEDDGAGGVWLSLARQVPAHREGVALAALRAVHPDRRLPRPVKAGFHGEETLVLLTRLAGHEMDQPTLEAALRLLIRVADEAAP